MTIKTWQERYNEACLDPVDGEKSARELISLAKQAEIDELRANLAEHKAARIAYASEFPLDADGEPDVGNIHANIRKLKKDADQAIKLLSLMFDKYDEGVQCYEEPEDCAGFMGNAVELNGDEFSEIVELLDRLAPRDAS